jgi:hypothetical protein
MLRIIDDDITDEGSFRLIRRDSLGLIKRKRIVSSTSFYVKKKNIKIKGKKIIPYNIRKGIGPHISWLKKQVEVKKVIFARLTDIAKNMGHQFIDMPLDDLYIGLRYHLYNEKLVIIRSTPDRNIIGIRKRFKFDTLPLWIIDKMKLVHYNEEIFDAMYENGELPWDGSLITKRYTTHIKDGICPRCNHALLQANHHIIPRKYNGPDTKENSIGLCNKCHDYVEIKTEEWIESGRYYNIDILRCMIINDGF